MKYRWIKNVGCGELESKLGCKVKNIVKGFDEATLQDFFEIDLDGENSNTLVKLDMVLQGMYREGGRDMVDVISDNIDLGYPNPQRAAFKASQLYGLSHEQLDSHIDGISNLAEAKEFMRKMAHVTLWLVKQTKLDE